MRIEELIASYTDEKRNNERFDFWLYNVGRRLSWPVAWAAVNLGVSATTVTLISAVFVWAGALLIAVGSYPWQIAGTLFFQLWIIFDCADGTVARATRSGSKRGEFADAFGGYSVSLLLYTSMGVAAAREVLGAGGLSLSGLLAPGAAEAGASGAVVPIGAVPVGTAAIAAGFLLAGAGGSLLSLFARLLYQKYLNIFADGERKAKPIKPREDRQNPLMIAAQNIAANSGLALPAAVAAVVFGWARLFALFYLAVNFAMLALTIKRTLVSGSGPTEPGSTPRSAPGAAT